MLIQNASSVAAAFPAARGASSIQSGGDDNKAPEPPKARTLGKKLITGTAYTAGGSMGGLVLGGIGGSVISNMTGNPLFGRYGGLVGAAAGGLSGVAASVSEEPDTLKRTLLAWTTATAGTAAGMWAVGGIGNALAASGASAFYAANGQLLGAAAGGLCGAALAFRGHRGPVSSTLKHSASATAGATVGVLLGGAAQMACKSLFPNAAYMTVAAPALGAVAGGLMGLALHMNGAFANRDYE